jgi:hypothetical protein
MYPPSAGIPQWLWLGALGRIGVIGVIEMSLPVFFSFFFSKNKTSRLARDLGTGADPTPSNQFSPVPCAPERP